MSIIIEGMNKEDFFRILLGANCGMFQKEKLDSYYGHKVKELPDDKVVCARLHVISEKVDGNQEEFHWEADNVLCELLESFGYKETVEYFKKHPKWYS